MPTQRSCTRWLCVAVILPFAGCVNFDVIEPEEWQEYEGQAGQTILVSFRVNVHNNTSSSTLVNFSLDGEDYWDNVIYQEEVPPGVHLVETVHPVEVKNPPETHWFAVFRADGPGLDQVPFRVVPPSQ